MYAESRYSESRCVLSEVQNVLLDLNWIQNPRPAMLNRLGSHSRRVGIHLQEAGLRSPKSLQL